MIQITEKINEIVDVRSNDQLEDFLADLAQTLSGYYFTDITSDLMAKWIDRVVVMPTGSGNAYALAGYRGVGKSHFLAAFGAILSQPDLRAKLKDSHVFASAERLIRRHYPVVHVRRGTKETLIEELKSGVAAAFDVSADSVGNTPAEIVKFTSDKGGAGPSVLIIDTDIERESRVNRDDGALLSEIAKAAEGTNVFVGVALDDDVAAADGRNSGIATSYQIDYLDHEHLYKIIDAHIFPKKSQKRSVITQIYENYRSALPSFRWSEQRMASVYPMHPVILEVAPFVRLFIQDFALLAFASSAGAKILTRPADSTIALDELFDSVEKNLRRSVDLADVFSAYDAINEKVVNKAPVMDRLRAKLVLKGLLLLSLDSEGATANDIAAAMLIIDERDPAAAVAFIENLLEKFHSASDGKLWRMERSGRSLKYGFNLSGQEHFNSSLDEAVKVVPDTVIPELLKRLMRERFGDCEFVDAENYSYARTVIQWRGGVRRGRLIWNVGNREGLPSSETHHPTDWEILIDFEPGSGEKVEKMPFIKWRLDALKPEEFDILKRYHALMSREDLQQSHRNEVRTAIQTYTIAIEKIWERKFLQYGVLVIDGSEHPFTQGALAGHSLSEVLGMMLAGHLERQYPEHPRLSGNLEMQSVDELCVGLFAARGSVSSEVEKLADAFAVPLGLAKRSENGIEVSSVDEIAQLPSVVAVMEMLKSANGEVEMLDLQQRLGDRPFGLTFETQCLIATALVARGLVEFVTKNGDRIGARSLDLKLVWDDVAGVALPIEAKSSDDKFVSWATRLTGRADLKTLDSDASRNAVVEALRTWLAEWNGKRLLERMDLVPDDAMTTQLWHLGARVRKSYGAAAEAAAALGNNAAELENCLRRIQEAFSGSETEFTSRSGDVETLRKVLDAIPVRNAIRRGVAFYESTSDERLEDLRRTVSNVTHENWSVENILKASTVVDEWSAFQGTFNEFAKSSHESSARVHDARDRANEIMASHEWWVFENLSEVDQFPTRFKRIAKECLRELRRCNCTLAVTEGRDRPPFCPVCGYTIRGDRNRALICSHLWENINQAIVAYDHVMMRLKADVIGLAKEFVKSNKNEDESGAAKKLIESLESDLSVADISENELRVLMMMLARMQSDAVKMHEFDESLPPVIVGEQIIEDVVVVH